MEEEKNAYYAKKLLPLRKRGNLLLCAIIFGNVCVNSVVAILMKEIAGGAIALAASTAVIVIFGEIVPQAIMHRNGVKAGAWLSPVLYITVLLTLPISFPIAAILDKIFG